MPQFTEAEAELVVQRRNEGLDLVRKRLRENSFAMVDSDTMKEWLNIDVWKRYGTSLDKVQPDLGQLWAEAPAQRSEGNAVIYKHKRVFHSSYALPAMRGGPNSEDNLGETPRQHTDTIVKSEDGPPLQRGTVPNCDQEEGKRSQSYRRSSTRETYMKSSSNLDDILSTPSMPLVDPALSRSNTTTPWQKTDDILSDPDGTLRQKYIVHDTTSTEGKATEHYTRFYPALPEKWRGHPVMAALHRLFAEIAAQSSQKEVGIWPPTGCDLFQFCYRTVHTALAGDPGPEGVHVDGATVTMLVVMRRDNIKPQTGGTRIWSSEQPTGKPTQEDIESEKLLFTWKPCEKFDTLFFLDENVKHEALQGELIDPSAEGLRDMFIMDCRRKNGAWCAREEQDRNT